MAHWHEYIDALLGREVSTITRYCSEMIQIDPRPEDRGTLFKNIDCKTKSIKALEEITSEVQAQDKWPTIYLYNGNFNHSVDIDDSLRKLKGKMLRSSRIVAVLYNPYLRFIYKLATRLGIRKGEVPSNFITNTDLTNIAKLAGFEVVRIKPAVYIPFSLLGLGDLVNKILPAIPICKWLSLCVVVYLRPVVALSAPASLSIIIPARNEKGNIENALKRIPILPGAIEIIFVEGHSTDETWQEINRVCDLYKGRFNLKAFKQEGKGKNDAVRLGFTKAQSELLVILDADLTVRPEELLRFYDAYQRGLGDFINGNRLVYPMEGKAMRFANKLGNIFFAKALAFILDTKIGDSLCGTKFISKVDYERVRAWRNDFGDFDPFGDFELLFPASILGLGVVDIPIHYKDRTYGTTNIHRFYHGALLFKMTVIGFLKVKLGR